MLRGMKQVVGRAKAIYSYIAVKDDELSLKPGDMINVFKMDLPDHGWWLGEMNGSVGVFPENFVRLLPESGDQNQGEDHSHLNSDLSSRVIPPKPHLPPQPKASLPNKPKLTAKVKETQVQNASSAFQGAEGFDFIKSSSKLANVTAGRVKGPMRRPPSRPTIDPIVESKSKVPALSGISELDSCWGGIKEMSPSRFREDPVKKISAKPEEKHLENKRPPQHKRLQESPNPGIVGQQKLIGENLQPEAKAEGMSYEEYELMQRELQALKADLKEQMQTNERMVQTLRNFLQEEREKIRVLKVECDQIKASVLSKIGFL